MFQKQTTTWYIHLLSLVLFCYLLSRAALCGITYDEAWTLTSFVPSSLQDIITFENCDANNHLLNTLSIKLLYSILPDTLFVARLPSLAGGLLYMFYAGRFSQRHSPVTSLMCFTLLSLNPFVLEFFSLARGYGLGLGMLTAGLFHGLLFYEQRSNKQLFLSQLFLSVAITAALSYLHLYLATQVLLFISLLRGERKKLLSGLLIQAGIAMAAGLLLYGPIQKLRANDNLYYGGHTGIYEDCLLSLGSYFSGGPPAGSEVRILLNVFLFLLFFLTLSILRRREKKILGFLFFLILLALSFFSISAQYLLMNTLYVTDRTALFLYPLLILFLGELVECLRPLAWQNSLSAVLTLLFFFNFLSSANVYKTSTWFFDAHSEEVIRYLSEKKNTQSVNLQYSWPMSKSLAYYRERLYPSLSMQYKSREAASAAGDYYLYLATGIDQVDYARGREHLLSAEKDTLLAFKAEHLYLFKLKSSGP
jgi:hypothetical protein